MENARKRSVKVLSFMLSLLVLYGSAGAVVSPLIETESIAASADGSEKIVPTYRALQRAAVVMLMLR